MVPKIGELISEFSPHCTRKNVGGTGGLIGRAFLRLI